jgi:lysophospholipase L1-like esterase
MYGTNDIQTSLTPTFAGVAGKLLGVWQMFQRRGIAAFACTLGPNTTSTDAWATTVNQTWDALRDNTVRLALNAWIRDGAPINASGTPVAAGTSPATRSGEAGHPLIGYFETADVMESARDSGVWKPGYTADGLHPTPTGYAAMAAVVDTSVLI